MSQLQDYRVQEYRLPSPHALLNVMYCVSLSVDSKNIPCATLKRRGSSWVIFVYISLVPYTTCVSCRPPYQQTQTAPSCSPSCTTLPGQEGKPCSGPHTRSPGRKWRDSGGSAAEFGPSSSSAIVGGHEIAIEQNLNNFVCKG
jgi:hypothetical protein